MKQLKNKSGQWAVRIICALALMFVSFGHQTPVLAGDGSSTAELAQYVLPDGSLPTLCVTVVDSSGKSHGKIAHLHGCEACRISASVMLPAPADVTGARLAFAFASETPRRVETIYRQIYPPNTGPRAPPAQSELG